MSGSSQWGAGSRGDQVDQVRREAGQGKNDLRGGGDRRYQEQE